MICDHKFTNPLECSNKHINSKSSSSCLGPLPIMLKNRVDCRVGVAVGTASTLVDVMVCDTQMMYCGTTFHLDYGDRRPDLSSRCLDRKLRGYCLTVVLSLCCLHEFCQQICYTVSFCLIVSLCHGLRVSTCSSVSLLLDT